MYAYIISHLPTGNVFPQVIAKRGQTHIAFASPDDCVPRLWHSHADAKRWLTVYCKGALVWAHDIKDDDPSSIVASLDPLPNTKRNLDDYRIVRVFISNA